MKKAIFATTFILIIAGLWKIQKPVAHSELPYVKAIYSKPVSYDPAQMNDGASLIFSELVYEGLLRFTENYGIQAGIAQSWKTSKDGKLLTFKINPHAKFHNGEGITARDVVVSLNRLISPTSKVRKYYEVIKKINEIDLHTVTIELKNPFPPFLYVLAGGTAKVLPSKYLNDKNFFDNPIGAGPFSIKKIGATNINLIRNKYYHGEKPKLKSIVLRAVNQEMAMQEAKQGKIHDLSSWPLSGMEDIFKQGQDISTIVADTWIIGLNSRMPPFNRLEVRKAFKASIDNEKFRKLFYPNSAKAYGQIPQGFPGHVKFERNKSKVVIIPEHEPITITIPKELEKANNMAKFFKNELSNKGWDINIKVMNWANMMKHYENKTLQSFLVSMIVDYPDSEFILGNFASNNPDNYSGISDDSIDSLLMKARNLQDRHHRYKIYEQLAQRINDLALSVNLFHSRPHYWLHSCVRNFRPNLLAVAYIDYRKISFNSNCLMEGKNE